MEGSSQRELDYAALTAAAEIRVERQERARTIAARLESIPADLVGVGPHAWEQCKRLLYYLALVDSGRQAARLASLTVKQFERRRASLTRLGLVAVAPQFSTSGNGETGSRIEDRITIDDPRIRHLAASAREVVATSSPHRRHVLPTSSPGPPHVVSTSSPPLPHVVSTSSPPLRHPRERVDNLARTPARAPSRVEDETIDRSIDRQDDARERDVGSSDAQIDWRRVREQAIGVTTEGVFATSRKTRRDVELVVKLFALAARGDLPAELVDVAITTVRQVRRVRNPYALLTRLTLDATRAAGLNLYAALASVEVPTAILPPERRGAAP